MKNPINMRLVFFVLILAATKLTSPEAQAADTNVVTEICNSTGYKMRFALGYTYSSNPWSRVEGFYYVENGGCMKFHPREWEKNTTRYPHIYAELVQEKVDLTRGFVQIYGAPGSGSYHPPTYEVIKTLNQGFMESLDQYYCVRKDRGLTTDAWNAKPSPGEGNPCAHVEQYQAGSGDWVPVKMIKLDYGNLTYKGGIRYDVFNVNLTFTSVWRFGETLQLCNETENEILVEYYTKERNFTGTFYEDQSWVKNQLKIWPGRCVRPNNGIFWSHSTPSHRYVYIGGVSQGSGQDIYRWGDPYCLSPNNQLISRGDKGCTSFEKKINALEYQWYNNNKFVFKKENAMKRTTLNLVNFSDYDIRVQHAVSEEQKDSRYRGYGWTRIKSKQTAQIGLYTRRYNYNLYSNEKTNTAVFLDASPTGPNTDMINPPAFYSINDNSVQSEDIGNTQLGVLDRTSFHYTPYEGKVFVYAETEDESIRWGDDENNLHCVPTNNDQNSSSCDAVSDDYTIADSGSPSCFKTVACNNVTKRVKTWMFDVGSGDTKQIFVTNDNAQYPTKFEICNYTDKPIVPAVYYYQGEGVNNHVFDTIGSRVDNNPTCKRFDNYALETPDGYPYANVLFLMAHSTDSKYVWNGYSQGLSEVMDYLLEYYSFEDLFVPYTILPKVENRGIYRFGFGFKELSADDSKQLDLEKQFGINGNYLGFINKTTGNKKLQVALAFKKYGGDVNDISTEEEWTSRSWIDIGSDPNVYYDFRIDDEGRPVDGEAYLFIKDESGNGYIWGKKKFCVNQDPNAANLEIENADAKCSEDKGQMRLRLQQLTINPYYTEIEITDPVVSEIEFCNETDTPIFSAYSLYVEDNWKSRSWLELDAGSNNCKQLRIKGNDLYPTYQGDIFIYGRGDFFDQRDATTPFCVNSYKNKRVLCGENVDALCEKNAEENGCDNVVNMQRFRIQDPSTPKKISFFEDGTVEETD